MNRILFITELKVAEIKKETIGVLCANVCVGTGAILNSLTLEPCTCQTEFLRRVAYTGAGIPRKYWDFALEDLVPEFRTQNSLAISIIRKYCDEINTVIKQGIGLYIQGVTGLAKTSLAFTIMKDALGKDIPCYAIRMSQLTKLLYDALSDESRKDELDFIKQEVKLLFIDEIEKDYNIGDTKRFTGNLVNDFFSYIYDNQKALIVTSNIPKTELKSVHAFNIVDRLQELIDIILIGESYRNPNTNLQKLMQSRDIT